MTRTSILRQDSVITQPKLHLKVNELLHFGGKMFVTGKSSN